MRCPACWNAEARRDHLSAAASVSTAPRSSPQVHHRHSLEWRPQRAQLDGDALPQRLRSVCVLTSWLRLLGHFLFLFPASPVSAYHRRARSQRSPTCGLLRSRQGCAARDTPAAGAEQWCGTRPISPATWPTAITYSHETSACSIGHTLHACTAASPSMSRQATNPPTSERAPLSAGGPLPSSASSVDEPRRWPAQPPCRGLVHQAAPGYCTKLHLWR